MDAERKWCSAEMSKSFAEKFKVYLREHDLKFEPSEVGRLVHFEVYMSVEERKAANEWINRHL